MKKLLLVLLVACMAAMTVPQMIFANDNTSDHTTVVKQDGRTITGIVKDENNMPIIGATVVVIGTQSSTITGKDGKYALTNVRKYAVIGCSYTGYISQEVVAETNTINFKLLPEGSALDQID